MKRSIEARRRLDMALALTDFGEEALRRRRVPAAHARVRRVRKRPGLSDPQIAAAVAAWYRDRPGAELGDSVGRPIALRGGGS